MTIGNEFDSTKVEFFEEAMLKTANFEWKKAKDLKLGEKLQFLSENKKNLLIGKLL